MGMAPECKLNVQKQTSGATARTRKFLLSKNLQHLKSDSTQNDLSASSYSNGFMISIFLRNSQSCLITVCVDVTMLQQSVCVARHGRLVTQVPGESLQTRTSPTHTSAAWSVIARSVNTAAI